MSIGIEQTNVALPRSIRATLRRLIRRARWVIFLRGICAVAAVATLAVLLVMAVDVAFTFTAPWPRWAMSCTALAFTLLAAALLLVRPLARSFTLSGIARAVESNHPELQERISSAVELLSSKDAPEVRGSQALIEAVVAGASEDVRLLRPRREVTLRGARPFILAAIVTLGVLAALMYFWPHVTGRLLARAVAPFMNLPNVAADELTVSPGDTVIKPGESLRVDVSTANLAVRGADVHQLGPNGTLVVQRMMSLSEASDSQLHFSAKLPPAAQDFRYRVRAGEALTRYYYVTVAAPPAVTGIDIRYDYPPYTHLKPLVQSSAAGDISAVVGTHVTVTAHVDKPVTSANLFLGSGDTRPLAGARQPAAGGQMTCTFGFDLKPGLKGYWHLTVSDRYAFKNPDREFSIEAVPDAPPTLLIVHPSTRQVRLKPTDSLPVIYAAQDDLGLASLDVLLKKDGADIAPMSLALAPDQSRVALSAAGQAAIDLTSPALLGAGKVEFRLRARDYLPPEMGGPHETLSDAYTITVDREAAPYAEQVRQGLEEDIRTGLEQALKELQAAQTPSAKAREELPKSRTVTQSVRGYLQQVSQHLAAADAAVRDVQQKVADTPFAPLQPKLEDVSANDIATAQDDTGQVPLTDDSKKRNDLAVEADTRVGAAVTKVSDLLKQFNAMSDALRQVGALEDMANREDTLAAERAAAESAPPPVPAADADWQQGQQDLLNDLSEFLKQTPEAIKAQLAADSTKLQDLAARARDLQKQQQALAADTQAVQGLKASDEQLQKLAQGQQDLAQRAGEELASADRKPGMTAAAEDLRGNNLEGAIQKQQAAEQALGNQAAGLRQQEALAALTTQAEKIAKEQGELADQALHAQQAIRIAHAQANSVEGLTASAAHEQAVAQQQLVAMAGSQPALQKQAEQLPEAAKDAGEAAGAAVQQHNPVPAMTQASAALDKNDLQKTVDASRSAAEQAQALANALHDQMAAQQQFDRRLERAARTTHLAADQAALRQQVQDLLAQRQALRHQLENSEVARLQQEQAEVARQAADLAPRAETVVPRLDQLPTQAAQSAHAAAESMRALDLAKAAENAHSAAEQLSGVADHVGPEAGELHQEAADLAAHQQRLAGQIAALTNNQLAQAIAPTQEQLLAHTNELAHETEDVQGRLGALFPQTPASHAASEATQFLSHAAGSEHEAHQALSSGAPEQALPPQTAGAEDLGHAADALDQAGQLYAQAVGALQLPEAAAENEQSGELISQAFGQAHEAAETAQAEPAAAAAHDLRAAQAAVAERAHSMGLTPFSLQQYLSNRMAYNVHPGEAHEGVRRPVPGNDMVALQQAGLGLDDWARLPSDLRNDILQAAGDTSPAEYRQLIKQYFQDIARLSTNPPAGGQP
jgi:hypothetical protein